MTKQETTGFYQFETPCRRRGAAAAARLTATDGRNPEIHDDESAVINVAEQEGSTPFKLLMNWVGPCENWEESMLWHLYWCLQLVLGERRFDGAASRALSLFPGPVCNDPPPKRFKLY